MKYSIKAYTPQGSAVKYWVQDGCGVVYADSVESLPLARAIVKILEAAEPAENKNWRKSATGENEFVLPLGNAGLIVLKVEQRGEERYFAYINNQAITQEFKTFRDAAVSVELAAEKLLKEMVDCLGPGY